MIRINLLGQARPKAARRAVPAGANVLIILVGVAVLAAGGALFVKWRTDSNELQGIQGDIDKLNSEKNRLLGLKKQVENFKKQQAILQQRIAVIEELKRNRTGGQELLEMMVQTVTRTEALWLTGLIRRGNSLTIDGQGASIASVANFITQLKRSGYFDKVEIKETKQDEENLAVQTFVFTLTADIVLPGTKPATSVPAGKSKS